jgi:hypothetical protein
MGWLARSLVRVREREVGQPLGDVNGTDLRPFGVEASVGRYEAAGDERATRVLEASR